MTTDQKTGPTSDPTTGRATVIRTFALPDVGEGLTEAEIVTWRVAAGDTVEVNDPVVEIETAKSLVELPSPFSGTVHELLAAEGDTVPVGTAILAVAVMADDAAPGPAAGPDAGAGRRSDAGPGAGQHDGAAADGPGGAGEPASGEREQGRAVLVGYIPPQGALHTRRSRPLRPPAPAAGAVPAAAAEAPSATVPPGGRPKATPPVRKLAKDLGVDLAAVPATGADGVVTRADVTRYAGSRSGRDGAAAPVGPPVREVAAPAGDTRTPVRGVRKATAEAMVRSAFTAPHVSLWTSVDVTRTVRLLRRMRKDPAFEGVPLSPMLLAARALVLTVRRHPEINATYDDAAGEIVLHHDVHLGIAAATDRGLLVPVLRDAGRLPLRDLAEGLAGIVATARAGKAAPADLTGGTITITNFGVFGIDGATPILTPGQSAILGLGRVRERPWVHRGRIRVRSVMDVVMSVDHRVIDGAGASAALADVAEVLERPEVALLRS